MTFKPTLLLCLVTFLHFPCDVTVNLHPWLTKASLPLQKHFNWRQPFCVLACKKCILAGVSSSQFSLPPVNPRVNSGHWLALICVFGKVCRVWLIKLKGKQLATISGKQIDFNGNFCIVTKEQNEGAKLELMWLTSQRACAMVDASVTSFIEPDLAPDNVNAEAMSSNAEELP